MGTERRMGMKMSFFDETEYVGDCFEKIEFLKGEVRSKEFVECCFVECDFSETIFRGCRFKECSFQKCNLSLIKVVDSLFAGVVFEDCKLIGVDWTQASLPAVLLSAPLAFLRCDISLSVFLGMVLKEMVMDDCRAHDVDFREADLSKGRLMRTDFAKSLFFETDLSETDLSHAKNYAIDIYQNRITKAKFSLPEAMSLLESMDIELT